jgi:hypothetical protein
MSASARDPAQSGAGPAAVELGSTACADADTRLAQTVRAISDRAERRPCGAPASLNRALTSLLKSTHFFVLHCDIAMQHLLSYVSVNR